MQTISNEEADQLVVENRGWAESIARSVARAWNMDWKNDGLDGAAYEALIFCARRFDPARKVPFRGYSRKRIHEAATEAARKSKGWNRRKVGDSDSDAEARAISSELLGIFPELRTGEISISDDDGAPDFRSAVRQLIVGASLVAARQQGPDNSSAEDVLDYKRLIRILSQLEIVHQQLMWKIYWEGESLRALADEWKTDELNVIREHKVVLAFLSKSIGAGRNLAPPRIRPGLKSVSLQLEKSSTLGLFTKATDSE